ncbi:MAG: TolC family protein, partial [Alphaproteobacteria bacterium]
AQVRAAGAATTVAASTFYPTLDAVGSVSRRDSSFPPNDDSWSAGLRLSFPIFTGGRDWFAVRGAEAEERRAKWNAAGVEEQAALDLERTFVAHEDSSEAVDVQKQFLEAATTRAEIARAQYTNGLLSFEDWDLIENDLIQTRTAVLSSERDAALAKARWDFARGAVEVQ